MCMSFIQFGNKLSFLLSAPNHGCGSHLMVTVIVDCMELTGEPIDEVCAGFQDRFQILELHLVHRVSIIQDEQFPLRDGDVQYPSSSAIWK